MLPCRGPPPNGPCDEAIDLWCHDHQHSRAEVADCGERGSRTRWDSVHLPWAQAVAYVAVQDLEFTVKDVEGLIATVVDVDRA